MEENEIWSEWLKSQHWDYFITITTRRPRHDRLALLRDVKDALLKIGFPRAYIAIEPFSGEGIHAHAIVATHSWNKVPLPETAWHFLFHRFGRSKVEPIRCLGDVAGYCSKYVSKGASEYDYYDYVVVAKRRGLDKLTGWLYNE